jgi:hypothetical protein
MPDLSLNSHGGALGGYTRENGRRNAPGIPASSVASLARWTPARESRWASVVRLADLHQAGHFVQSTLSAKNSWLPPRESIIPASTLAASETLSRPGKR